MILKFKIVVLQSLYNLSDEQTEYLIRDRPSFMRFLDLELEDPVLGSGCFARRWRRPG
jgi:transposase, IS5 family